MHIQNFCKNKLLDIDQDLILTHSQHILDQLRMVDSKFDLMRFSLSQLCKWVFVALIGVSISNAH